jgi:hypothetical protein
MDRYPILCHLTAIPAGLLAASLALTASAARGGPPPPDPRNAIHQLLLEKAVSDTRDLALFLRAEDGRFAAGVVTGFNGPVDVDGSGLTLDGGAVAGRLKVTIGFDGFFPPDGRPLVCEYRLDATAAEGSLRGKYDGTAGPGRRVAGGLTGSLSPPPDMRGYWVMDLQMENGSGTGTLGPKSWGNRVYPRLFLKDSRPVQSLIYGWGKRAQINYFESAVVANNLILDGKRLTGTLTVQPTGPAPGSAGGVPFVFTFDGPVVGARISGTFRKQVGGNEHAGGSFHGTLQPMPERALDRSLYYLELHGAVLRTWQDAGGAANALQLMTFVPCLRGRFGAGLAYAAAWNHSYHDVDAGGLKLHGNTLTGELKATMNPDPYVPPDKKPVAASYVISATVTDGRVIGGSFTGFFKDRKVSGPVFGELLDQPPVPEPVAVHLKLEDGVSGGAPWLRRTYVHFVAAAGQARSGSMSNNKNGWKGTFRKAEVKFDGPAFAATIEGTVDETNGPAKGPYTFKLTGRVVGDQLVGACDTYLEGRLAKSGTAFMGGFGPAPKPAGGAAAEER